MSDVPYGLAVDDPDGWDDAACLPQEPDRRLVYFMQGAEGGPIKIGVALDPDKRRRELQTGHPYELKILKVVPGGCGLEYALHHKLAVWRTHGEWFEPCLWIDRMLHEPGYVESFLPKGPPALVTQPGLPSDPFTGACSVCGVDLENAYGEQRYWKLSERPTMCAVCVEVREMGEVA